VFAVFPVKNRLGSGRKVLAVADIEGKPPVMLLNVSLQSKVKSEDIRENIGQIGLNWKDTHGQKDQG
jgi:hypothetical protein